MRILIMKRFQVRLEDDMVQMISEIKQETGKTRTEIIRRIMKLGVEHWHLKQQYGTRKPFGKGSLMVAERKAMSAALQTLLIVRKLADKLLDEEARGKARAEIEAQLGGWWHYGEDDK